MKQSTEREKKARLIAAFKQSGETTTAFAKEQYPPISSYLPAILYQLSVFIFHFPFLRKEPALLPGLVPQSVQSARL